MSNIKRFKNAPVLFPAGLMHESNFTVCDGRFLEVDDDRHNRFDSEIDLEGSIVLPGFFDVQVNGGGGVLFNEDPSVETLRTIFAAHLARGTTSFLPTLISGDLKKVESAIKAVQLAIEQDVAGVRGIHFEGPFLNPQKKGVHDASKFKEPDQVSIDLISGLPNGSTLVTLAPERVKSSSISELVSRGVTVSAGHTMADYEQSLVAIDAGLTGFTHLFNAMPKIESRAPGCITAALECANTYCGLIVDGHHVDPAVLRMAIRAKADAEGMFLVSDAMTSVGADLTEFSLFGETVLCGVENA